MSAKKKVQKKISSNKKIVWAIALSVILLLLGGIWYAVQGQYSVEQRRMEGYLQDKYGEKFAVGLPTRHAAGFGVMGYLQATAYSTSNNNLTFPIYASSSGFTDDYLGAVWSREEAGRLQPSIDALTKEGYKINLVIVTTGTTRGTIDSRGTPPGFQDAVKKYGHKIFYQISLHSNRLPDQHEQSRAADAILRLIPKLPIDGVDVLLDYQTYYKKEGRNYKYGASLDNNDLIKIDTKDKIISNFKEWQL